MEHKKSDNTELFERMPVPKAVLTMALPAIAGQLIVLLYSIADTFFIGRTNDPAMVAAASLILPVFNLAIPISAITGTGGGTLISRLLGSKRPEDAKKVYSFSVRFSMLLAVLFSLLAFLFRGPLLRALGASADVIGHAEKYMLCVIVAGGIPTVMTNVLANLLRSTGESKRAGFGVMMGGLLNIGLDPLFMFVIMPKGMEVVGAGIATCLSNCISCIYFICTVKNLGSGSVLRLCPLKELPDKKLIARIFTVGVPSAATGMLFDLDNIVIDRLMSAYGDAALAAVGIVLKAERFPQNVGIGICQGMMPIIAYNFAAGNDKRLNDVRVYSLKIGLLAGIASLVLYELFAPQIIRFFIEDAATIALGTKFLRIRSLAACIMFFCFFHVFLFNGYGEGGIALFLGVLRWIVFNIPLLFLFNALFGMYGIVWTQLAGDIPTIICSFLIQRRFMKKHIAERDKAGPKDTGAETV